MAKFQPDNRNLITKDPALGLLWMCHAEIAFSGDDVHVSPAVLLFNWTLMSRHSLWKPVLKGSIYFSRCTHIRDTESLKLTRTHTSKSHMDTQPHAGNTCTLLHTPTHTTWLLLKQNKVPFKLSRCHSQWPVHYFSQKLCVKVPRFPILTTHVLHVDFQWNWKGINLLEFKSLHMPASHESVR